MRSSLVRSTLASTIFAIAACSGGGSTQPVGYCAAPQPTAIIAVVTDSVTGLVPAAAASGVVQAGAYVDTLRSWGTPPGSLSGGGIAGSYSVRISLAGYADWTRSNIVVTPSGVCSELNTVTLQAKLVPAP